MMEFLDGEPLLSQHRARPRTRHRTWLYTWLSNQGRQTATALSLIHEKNIVHGRDLLQTGNISLCRENGSRSGNG